MTPQVPSSVPSFGTVLLAMGFTGTVVAAFMWLDGPRHVRRLLGGKDIRYRRLEGVEP